ncbi:hypothetical protein Ccrd_026261 [Cynara cardunculus var. scolymus]|uniref:Uncharacterized protein n=1 Tax=Cynara cardunculus var. scolymus TaxID=59895 RepID=A0A124RCB9_CYNCS|nr:hypothetical protein Ccrd_026261 [Cynara cardunculus var. scolymus]
MQMRKLVRCRMGKKKKKRKHAEADETKASTPSKKKEKKTEVEKDLAKSRVDVAHEIRLAKEAEAAMDRHVNKAVEKAANYDPIVAEDKQGINKEVIVIIFSLHIYIKKLKSSASQHLSYATTNDHIDCFRNHYGENELWKK